MHHRFCHEDSDLSGIVLWTFGHRSLKSGRPTKSVSLLGNSDVRTWIPASQSRVGASYGSLAWEVGVGSDKRTPTSTWESRVGSDMQTPISAWELAWEPVSGP